MNTFGYRLDILIRQVGGKKKASEALNISTEQIRRWSKEMSDPSFSKMKLLCELTDTSMDWLAGINLKNKK